MPITCLTAVLLYCTESTGLHAPAKSRGRQIRISGTLHILYICTVRSTYSNTGSLGIVTARANNQQNNDRHGDCAGHERQNGASVQCVSHRELMQAFVASPNEAQPEGTLAPPKPSMRAVHVVHVEEPELCGRKTCALAVPARIRRGRP